MKSWIVLAALVLALAATGCRPRTDGPAPASRIMVATSTAVLADMIRNVAGDRVEVTNIVPADRAPALYEIDPRDAITISRAKAFFANGWGYESPSVGQLVQQTAGLRVVLLSEGMQPQETVIDHGDHEHRFANPYMYLNVKQAITYVSRVRHTLTEIDPEHASTYDANAQAYEAKLRELDTWIGGEIGRIPEAKRKLLTDHASFPYFADRYGLKSFAASYEGTAEATPSPSQYAYLIDQVKQWGVTTAFGEEGLSPKLLQQLARDTGVRFVPGLRTSTLDAASGVGTYIEMMHRNTTVIVGALT